MCVTPHDFHDAATAAKVIAAVVRIKSHHHDRSGSPHSHFSSPFFSHRCCEENFLERMRHDCQKANQPLTQPKAA